PSPHPSREGRGIAPICVVVFFLACLAPAIAADWPRFLGPHGNGVVDGANVARSWPAEGTRELWRAGLNSGFGGAAIAAGYVYILDRIEDKQDTLRVFNLQTGKQEWSYSYAAPGSTGGYPGARSTPTVDAGNVYTLGPLGHLHCISLKTHQPVWSKHIEKDLGARPSPWHVSQSPLVVKDLLVISLHSDQYGLVALHKNTGEIAWRSAPIGNKDSYTSPILATIGGVEQIVTLEHGTVAGVEPGDGKVLWRYSGYKPIRPVANPTIMSDGRIFMTGGWGSGCAMIRVAKTGNQFTVKELFRDRRNGSKLHPALWHDGYLYTNCEDIGEGLQCMSVNGIVKWKTGRSPDFDLGSLLIADGLIFIMDGRRGLLRLVEATPQGYKELAQAQVLTGSNIYASMALADGKLIVRSQTEIKCLEVGAR
ncbi:MAG: PQQ-like beta-propeller repeat protein, partial [Armatimonadota bacterium]|nr:PQQ-like beta-propeller repeat protein [Armatimonadota bacterium]